MIIDDKARRSGGLAGWQQKKLAEFIEAHLDEVISLQRLAEIAQLSRFHFGRSFKHSFGLPPHRYLINRRMERGKSLLRERARSVTEIGLMLGFSETSSFTTSFRRAMGVTPTEYRRALPESATPYAARPLPECRRPYTDLGPKLPRGRGLPATSC
jgi:AraC family transcriptional regulator